MPSTTKVNRVSDYVGWINGLVKSPCSAIIRWFVFV
jgi:hypothetical protein